MQKNIFIAGIDTDVGKTIITGLLAKYIQSTNKSVITQKIAQTGCKGISEDIQMHRKIMGVELFNEDINKTTCPYVFNLPASPHLSAQLQGVKIEVDTINKSTQELNSKYEHVIIEGVGGVFVPLTRNYTTLDYLSEQKLDVILVTTPKLGSINHTLMTIDALFKKNINILGLVYNLIGEYDDKIKADSKLIFGEYLEKYAYVNNIIDIKKIEGEYPLIKGFKVFLGV